MTKNILTLLILVFFGNGYGQNEGSSLFKTEKVLRVNFLNPGVEYELPTGYYSTFSAGLGVGYGGSYPDLNDGGSTGLVYMIAPFIDIQHKWFYNLEKRLEKDKAIVNNSGNFISARLLTRGNSIADNINRTSDFDFAIMPTWVFKEATMKNSIYYLILVRYTILT